MGRIWILLLLSCLISIPAAGQNVYIKGNNQAAIAAKAGLRKYTGYNLTNNAGHTILEVRQETWSQTLLSPPTTAVNMKLFSGKGRLLWSRTEPVGSRTEGAVVQELLKDLAKARPKIG